MFSFRKICRTFENMTDDERRASLIESARLILPELEKTYGNGVPEFILFIFAACGADGVLDASEYKLFSEVTGIELSYSEAYELVSSADTQRVQDTADDIIDMFGLLSNEVKASMITFCLLFLSANGEISRGERKFLKKLIK